MSFPRYQSYKESGVELLGAVPDHWDLKRFKRIFKEREERSVGGNELLLSVSAYTGVSPRSEVIDDGDHLSRADSLEGYKVCHKDDLVVNIMLAWNRGLAFTSYHGIVSPAYCVYFVIDGSHPNFLNYLVRSNEYTLYFKAFSSGVIDSRLRIYPETFGRLFCALPPLAEQTAIAAFLDRETAKIDALVAEQQRLMELLKEKRQAVISHAVTKGLNPIAPMKPSGIEWLGDVPAHWEMTRLGWVCSEINDINHVMPDAVATGVPFLSAKDLLDDGTLNFTEDIKMISEEDYSNLSKKICPRRGDIIYSRIGACLGKARLVETDERFLVSYSCCVVRVVETRASNRFIQHLLDGEMILTEARMRTQGIGVPDLGLGEIGRFPVPLPPMNEQVSIADYLDEEESQFDALAAETQRAIDLLQERRTALISAAVTGQIDVRNH